MLVTGYKECPERGSIFKGVFRATVFLGDFDLKNGTKHSKDLQVN